MGFKMAAIRNSLCFLMNNIITRSVRNVQHVTTTLLFLPVVKDTRKKVTLKSQGSALLLEMLVPILLPTRRFLIARELGERVLADRCRFVRGIW